MILSLLHSLVSGQTSGLLFSGFPAAGFFMVSLRNLTYDISARALVLFEIQRHICDRHAKHVPWRFHNCNYDINFFARGASSLKLMGFLHETVVHPTLAWRYACITIWFCTQLAAQMVHFGMVPSCNLQLSVHGDFYLACFFTCFVAKGIAKPTIPLIWDRYIDYVLCCTMYYVILTM